MRCQQSCHMQMDQSQWNSMFILQYLLMYILYIYTGWLFRTFFIFPNSWYDDPIWLIFFRGVETTNQYVYNIYTYTYGRRIIYDHQLVCANQIPEFLIPSHHQRLPGPDGLLCLCIWDGDATETVWTCVNGIYGNPPQKETWLFNIAMV